MQQLTTTSISIYTNAIPRRTGMTVWRMCAHAAMALTMLVLSRGVGTSITTMITRCHRSRHSLVPSPAPLEATAVLHSLTNNNNNICSSSSSSNCHPDPPLPLVGLSVPENPTEARIPVTMARVEVGCSPGPRGRAKNLHQYDRRFLYFRSSFPWSFYLFLLLLTSLVP